MSYKLSSNHLNKHALSKTAKFEKQRIKREEKKVKKLTSNDFFLCDDPRYLILLSLLLASQIRTTEGRKIPGNNNSKDALVTCLPPMMPCTTSTGSNLRLTGKIPEFRSSTKQQDVPPCQSKEEQAWQITANTLLNRIPCQVKKEWDDTHINLFSYEETIQEKFKQHYLKQIIAGSSTANGMLEKNSKNEKLRQMTKQAQDYLAKGLDYVWELAKSNKDITLVNIQILQGLLLTGKKVKQPLREKRASLRRMNGEKIGIEFPASTIIPKVMNNILRWINKNNGSWHHVLLGIHIRQAIPTLHPFDDGNGRLATLLSAYAHLRRRIVPIADNYLDKGFYTSIGKFSDTYDSKSAPQFSSEKTPAYYKKNAVHRNAYEVMTGGYPEIPSYLVNPNAFWQSRDYEEVFLNKDERNSFLQAHKNLGKTIVEATTKRIEEQVTWVSKNLELKEEVENETVGLEIF